MTRPSKGAKGLYTPRHSKKQTRLLLWLSLSFVFCWVAWISALWVWLQLQETEKLLGDVKDRVENVDSCPGSPLEEAGATAPVVVAAPPEDSVTEANYIGENGRDTAAWMVNEIKRVLNGREITTRLGDSGVLQPSKVHVMNLWATHCEPCKKEMPELRALFSRNADSWGSSVRFVPVQTLDFKDSVSSYKTIEEKLPGGDVTVKLADKSEGFRVTYQLEGLELSMSQIPVTLVLDCNRRVRWKNTGRLRGKDFIDLEQTVERLRRELADDGPKGKCGVEWCGNGRCEPGERHSCPADCGDARSRSRTSPENQGDAASAPEVDPETRCEKPLVWRRGKCIPRLKNETVVEPAAEGPRCGDDQCQGNLGENSQTCCLDCGCARPFKCVDSPGKGRACRIPKLKEVK